MFKAERNLAASCSSPPERVENIMSAVPEAYPLVRREVMAEVVVGVPAISLALQVSLTAVLVAEAKLER